jgi:hypothetical protein|tara:strand:- start:190 stop:528 length:339 start_codon:yes stop_codon:yes gene_type:complete
MKFIMKSINPFLFAAVITALGGCISLSRHINSPSGNSPPSKPPVVFAELDEDNDGNVTKEELDAYNEKKRATALVYNEPTVTFAYIMLAVVFLCAGSMAYEVLKVKKENKKK